MWEINWKKFEIKNPKATEAFETLCYFCFAVNLILQKEFGQTLIKLVWKQSR